MRPPHGRTAPLTLLYAMRRSPRTPVMALLLAVVALAATGCGGSEVAADEVPGAPPALTVPTDSDLGGGNGNAESSSGNDNGGTTDENGTTDESGATATPTPEATTPPADTSGGTTAPETGTTDDTAANDTPPAGAEAEQFESFCEQNAGAC